MRMHKIFIFLLALLVAQAACAQTDIAGSVFGAFSTTAQGHYTTQIPSNAAGGLLEVQHAFHPILSFEVTYSYNRANQVDNTIVNGAPQICLAPCLPTPRNPPVPVSANAHEFTADWIPSKTKGALRPFGVLGGGVLMVVPSGGQSNTTTATKPVFVFGLGMDWARWKRVGLRFQYRGNLYSAPLLTTQYASTGSLMLTNEPMVGVYFRLP